MKSFSARIISNAIHSMVFESLSSSENCYDQPGMQKETQ